MEPVGSHLTPSQLIDALLWNLSPNKNSRNVQETFTVNELDVIGEKLISALSATRTLRNMLSPIFRLPSETLARIFEDMLLDHFVNQNYSNPPRSYRQDGVPMFVASVCRYWKDTIKTHPSLWSFVFTGSLGYANAALSRSGEVPLKVHLGSGDPSMATLNNPDFIENLANQSHRFKELHIDHQHCLIDANLLQPFHFPAPLLESLSIVTLSNAWGSPQWGGPAAWVPGSDLALPTLFDGQTPSLRRLTLHSFTSWPGNRFENLTYINLSSQLTSQHELPSLWQFLDFLRASPQLEELISVNSGIAVDEIETRLDLTYPPVTLDHLRSASFGWWPTLGAVRQVLFHLNIPRTASLYVWGDYGIDESHDLSSLHLSHSAQHFDHCEINELRIVRNAIVFDSGWGGYPGGNEDTIINRGSAIQYDGRLHQVSELVSGLQTSLPQVESLWIGSQFGSNIGLQQWKTLFECMPSLTTLVIWHASVDAIIACLTILSRSPTDLVCPKLDAVHIYGDASLSGYCLSLFITQRAAINHPLSSIQFIANDDPPELQLDGQPVIVTHRPIEEYSSLDTEKFIAKWPPPGYKPPNMNVGGW